jgi:ABC-2 type transport system permease protein
VFAQGLHGFVQFTIEMSLLAIVLLIFGSPLLPMLPFTILLMLLVALFAVGIALLLASVNVYFRDTAYLWTIITQLWFFATPIVYPPSILDDRVSDEARRLLALNPFAHYAEGFRRTMYDARPPGVVATTVLAVVSIATLAIGWVVFTKLSRRFSEEL